MNSLPSGSSFKIHDVITLSPFFLLLLLFHFLLIIVMILVFNNQTTIAPFNYLTLAFRHLGSYLWLMILSGIIIIGGYFLFLIPGLIFSIWFTFGAYALFIEDYRGLKALMRSKDLVRGRFWSVTWRIVFMSLISALTLVPFALVQNITHMVFIGVLQQLWVYFFILPLTIAYYSTCYRALLVQAPDFVFQKYQARSLLLIGILGCTLVPLLLLTIAVSILRAIIH